MADDVARCPYSGPTVKALENVDPYGPLAALRTAGPVQFDQDLGAWTVSTYEACQYVFRNDKDLFVHPDSEAGGAYKSISKGRRHPKTLDGEQHTRLHNWLAQRFSPRQTSALRENLIRQVIDDVIDGFAAAGAADLTSQFADHIPIRVIASVMDLPWRDRGWIGEVKAVLDQIGAFYDKRMAGDSDLTKRTGDAFDRMRVLLDPIIEARRSGEGDDIVSQMWREGPSLLEGWNEEDVYINITSLFIGGYDTTTMAISNAIKILLDDPKMMEEVRTADDARLRCFIDESLRLLPPVQYRARRARADLELAGHTIKAGEMIAPLIASANRDGDHYGEPDGVDLQRKKPTDHLTFITGPRTCIGAGLARTEVAEAVRQLLSRIKDLRYDPGRPAPSYTGLVLRRFQPIHTVFTPERVG